MSYSKRDAAACWLFILLFAVTIGEFTATAQTASVDRDRWTFCSVTSLVGEPYHQGPNFDIRVSFRGQPISGVKVVLIHKALQPDVAATANTDLNGVAHFSAIRPGMYQAQLDEALLAPNPEIEVDTNRSDAQQVAIEWPWAASTTRSARGWLSSWQKDSSQNRGELRPLAHALVQLFDLRSGKLLASTHTSTDGYYEFAGASDNLYVVRFSEAQGLSGTAYDKAVEVVRQASRDSLPRMGVNHECGGALVELPDMIDPPNEAVAKASASIPTD